MRSPTDTYWAGDRETRRSLAMSIHVHDLDTLIGLGLLLAAYHVADLLSESLWMCLAYHLLILNVILWYRLLIAMAAIT